MLVAEHSPSIVTRLLFLDEGSRAEQVKVLYREDEDRVPWLVCVCEAVS